MQQIVILGGGAAGLAAALAAAQSAPAGAVRVTVLDRNPRCGKKLLATGNGRCNLDNTGIAPEQYFTADPAALRPLLAAVDAAAPLEWFAALGLYTRTDEAGRVYPYSNQAADVLALPVPSGRARVIRLHPGSLVTDAEEHAITCVDGLFDARRNSGLCKLAVFERHKATGKVGVGILAGYGLRGGAVATSVSHDSHNIVVCGDNDADMLAAVRRVAAMGGGIAVAGGGRILDELPLPVAGLMTPESPQTVVRALDSIHALLHDHGVPGNVAPLMALSFMALPVIPSLKLTARGLFSVADWRFVSVDAAAQH